MFFCIFVKHQLEYELDKRLNLTLNELKEIMALIQDAKKTYIFYTAEPHNKTPKHKRYQKYKRKHCYGASNRKCGETFNVLDPLEVYSHIEYNNELIKYTLEKSIEFLEKIRNTANNEMFEKKIRFNTLWDIGKEQEACSELPLFYFPLVDIKKTLKLENNDEFLYIENWGDFRATFLVREITQDKFHEISTFKIFLKDTPFFLKGCVFGPRGNDNEIIVNRRMSEQIKKDDPHI